MGLDDKNILILGLGISGISMIKALNKENYNISVYDSKKKEELKDILEEIKDINFKGYFNDDKIKIDDFNLLIKSPGIKTDMTYIKEANSLGIPVITDIEMAYRLSESKNFIGVTGTNGKTTTTTLIGNILKDAGLNTYIGGNIGIGIMDIALEAKSSDIILIEASSFQLNNIIDFKPKISLIINLSPDHLDWHGNYNNYIRAKENIFKNQDNKDYTILNYDDKYLKGLENKINSNIIWFSTKSELDNGIFIRDNKIISKFNNKENEIMDIKDINLLGEHNLENILGAIGVSYALNIDNNSLRKSIINFTPVEHRLEYIGEKNNVKFYNDSKGTNVDASMVAIKAMERPSILIAGGYDKGSEYLELVRSFDNKIKELVLFGQTREKIESAARELGYNNIHIVNDMKEAVEKAYYLSKPGYAVLLSPACASWGMYDNFEMRGKDFKDKFLELKED